MRKWECLVCGLIYDEAEGWPEDGIKPGTKWEDVPDDWTCPDCGVGKEDFELLEEKQVDDEHQNRNSVSNSDSKSIIIIGTGLAGYGLAKELRKHDPDIPLTIISSDEGHSYSKPALSSGFTKKTSASDLVQQTADQMAEKLKAKILTFTEVHEIDTEQQLVKIGDAKTTIPYDKLVLALGSSVIRPPIDGDGANLIHSINDWADYQKFRSTLVSDNVKTICIIGGGLIGSEFANDLVNGGIDVSVVDQMSYPLPSLVPEQVGQALRSEMESGGVKFYFETLVTSVNKRESGASVHLNSGAELNADLVISAVGVRPRTDLAQKSGIEINRGIITNQFLETSASNVYALGDCAEVCEHVMVYVAPLMAEARALGKTLAGVKTEVFFPAMPVVVKTPLCPVVVSPPATGADGEWSFIVNGTSVKSEFRDESDKLLGFALTGAFTGEKVALQRELPNILCI